MWKQDFDKMTDITVAGIAEALKANKLPDVEALKKQATDTLPVDEAKKFKDVGLLLSSLSDAMFGLY